MLFNLGACGICFVVLLAILFLLRVVNLSLRVACYFGCFMLILPGWIMLGWLCFNLRFSWGDLLHYCGARFV